MQLRQLIPFAQASPKTALTPDAPEILTSKKRLAKVLRMPVLALGYNGLNLNRTDFEPSPYDFEKIIDAVDTDSYVKQAFFKHQDLMWKSGWSIVGENMATVDYLYQRLDLIEAAIQQPLEDFFQSVTDQLFKFSNVFIVKVRGDIRQVLRTDIRGHDGLDPIVGYQIIPAETVEIRRDKYNNVKEYRQVLDSSDASLLNYRVSSADQVYPRWAPDEVIHLSLDKRPGTAFGTPFICPVLDDIIALRQIEQDITNLVHKELFPLYTYTVGSEAVPAEPEELEQAKNELAGLRTDGGLILPERHTVEVLGAQNQALDATEYLAHFKERVAVGLGLSPHHLGMIQNGGNRAMTDRLDIALYDRIKKYQRYFASAIRLHMLNELLFEVGFNPLVSPQEIDISDRCDLKFNEIDIDTQIKRENHEIQKFSSNIKTLPESRLSLGDNPDPDNPDLLMGSIQTHWTAKQAALANGSGATSGGGSSSSGKAKPDAAKPSPGSIPNFPNTTKGVNNKSRPANQHGRRPSPNIRHALDVGKVEELVDLLDEEDLS